MPKPMSEIAKEALRKELEASYLREMTPHLKDHFDKAKIEQHARDAVDRAFEDVSESITKKKLPAVFEQTVAIEKTALLAALAINSITEGMMAGKMPDPMEVVRNARPAKKASVKKNNG